MRTPEPAAAADVVGAAVAARGRVVWITVTGAPSTLRQPSRSASRAVIVLR
jgi:hypothetical protein